MKIFLFALIGSASLLAACDNTPDDADDARENAIEARAAAAGPAVAALGLSQAQLLEAELIDSAGVDLGDVEDVVLGTDGQVARLLVEIEDSNPDRFVEVAVAGLRPVTRGGDTDLETSLTRGQLAALPNAVLAAP